MILPKTLVFLLILCFDLPGTARLGTAQLTVHPGAALVAHVTEALQRGGERPSSSSHG